MTTYYVDDTATGANNGGAGNDAWTSFHSFITGTPVAGDIVYIAHTHDELFTSDVSITQATFAAPITVVSVDFTSSYAFLAGATLRTTASSADNFHNYCIWKGVTLDDVGDFYVHGNQFDDCTITSSTTDSLEFRIQNVANEQMTTKFNDTTLNLDQNATVLNSFSALDTTVRGELRGCTLVGHASNDLVICNGQAVAGDVQLLFEGCDFSGFAGVFTWIAGWEYAVQVDMVGCTVPASFVAGFGGSATTNPHNLTYLTIRNYDTAAVDVSDTTIPLYHEDMYGKVETSRDEYHSASHGVHSYSWKMTANANTSEAFGMRDVLWCPIQSAVWLAAGSNTLTVEIANNSATAIQSDEFLIDVLSPATTGVAAFNHEYNTTVAFEDDYWNGTPANHTTSSGWTGLGGTNTQQKMVHTVTAHHPGPALVKFGLRKASEVFVCPKVVVS